jgi:hypothetical protein
VSYIFTERELMGILSFLGDIFTPLTSTINSLHTSTEEKLKLQNELAKIQSDLQGKFIDLEGKVVEADAKIRAAEAGSQYMITAVWRPAASIMFVLVIGLAAFDLIPKPDAEFYSLAKTFLGIYGGGRSAETVAKSIVEKLGKG